MTKTVNSSMQVMRLIVQKARLCVDIQYVQKILPLPMLETIPGSPKDVAGLMNVAGASVPVIDLALRLGLVRDQSYSMDMPIVLCTHHDKTIGWLVDAVLGLAIVHSDNLQMQADFSSDAAWLAVVGIDSELFFLLNMQRLLASGLSAETFTLPSEPLTKAASP